MYRNDHRTTVMERTTTTISLRKETKDLLRRFGSKGQTYDEVIRDLIEKAWQFWKEKVGFRVVTSWPLWVAVGPRGANVRFHLCPDFRPEKGNTGCLFATVDAAEEET